MGEGLEVCNGGDVVWVQGEFGEVFFVQVGVEVHVEDVVGVVAGVEGVVAGEVGVVDDGGPSFAEDVEGRVEDGDDRSGGVVVSQVDQVSGYANSFASES